MSTRLLPLLLALATTFSSAATQPWIDNPELGPKALEEQWAAVHTPGDRVGIRGVFRFAIEAAGLRWHPERIETALALARSMQDLDPASPTYGNFRWQRGHSGVFDLNGVEFAMAQATLLRRQFSDVLTDRARQQLDELIATGIEGLRRHDVPLTYTNIIVKKFANLIAAGELLGRADVADEGYRLFDQWFDWTASAGISEFGAVTYYGIDLDSLVHLARHAGRPEARAKAEAAMRYLWTDIAANWWAPGDRLGGANSRSYDYLYGRGYLEAHTWHAGWLRARPELEGAGWIPARHRSALVTYYRECSWAPPPELTEPIRSQIPRVIVQRWGTMAGQRAVHHIGRHFSLGTSGATTNRDDRPLVANLGDSPAIPQVVLFMDGRGDPFGTKKKREAQGAMKSLHLTPFIATVQRGPEALMLLSDEPLNPAFRQYPGPRSQPGELSCFLTQLLVPAAAEVWSTDQRIEPGSDVAPALLAANQTFFIRLGNAALAVRFLEASTTTGAVAPIHYVEEKPGDPARRITVVHSDTEPHARASTVLWVRGTENLDDERFTSWRREMAEISAISKIEGSVVTTSVAGIQGEMRIMADIVKGTRLALEGGEPEALLSVNGRDVGRETLWPHLTPPASEFELLRRFPVGLLQGITANAEPDENGLVGHNRPEWYEAGMQRSAAWRLIAAAVEADLAKANRAWLAVDATFSRQLDDGGFLSKQTPHDKCAPDLNSRVTTAFFWLQELSHALLVLEQSPLAPAFAERIKTLRPRLHRAYAFISTDIDAIIRNHKKATNRLFIAAKAFALGSVFLKDEKLEATARRIIDIAREQQNADGVLLENGGADSSYNAVSLLFAQAILIHLPDPRLDAALDRAMAWQLTQIDPATGEISTRLNTRTAIGKEAYMGKPKGINFGEVALALNFYAQRKGRPDLATLAEQVLHHPAAQKR